MNYAKELFNLHKDLAFLPEIKKVEKVKKNLFAAQKTRKNMLFT